MEIDTNLYSRQIGTYGMEAMGKLVQLNVLIYGLRGVNTKLIIKVRSRSRKEFNTSRSEICDSC